MYFQGLGIACLELQQLQHCNKCIIICVNKESGALGNAKSAT